MTRLWIREIVSNISSVSTVLSNTTLVPEDRSK
jgi:hypothetical protein